LLFLFGTVETKFLDQFYKKRWVIETAFQAFKSRGFNLEQPHLKSNDKLKKLVALVAMGYVFCISLGIFRHNKDKKIKIKSHNRKANSFFRYGLNFIRDGFNVGYKYQNQWCDLFTQFIKFIFVNHSLSSD
jgi:Transposase DDE domain